MQYITKAILAAFIWCGIASAATIYVSPTGNDGNNGSAPSSAVKSINRAVQIASSPTDVVEVAAGTYGATVIEKSTKTAGWNSNLVIKSSGTAATLSSIKVLAKRITLRNFKTNGGVAVEYGADYCRLEYIVATGFTYWENYADNVTWYYCQGNQPFSDAKDVIRIGSSYHEYRPINMVVEGCCFRGSDVTGSAGNHIDLVQVLGARSITFKNSIFYKAPTGVFMMGPGPIENVTWDGCYIGGGSFYTSNESNPGNVIKNCIIDGTIRASETQQDDQWFNNKIKRWSPNIPWPKVFQGNVIKIYGWNDDKPLSFTPPAGNTHDPNLVISKPDCPDGGGVISSLNFHGSRLSGPPPLQVTFNNTSSSDYTSFAWNFGDGATSTDKSPTHTYTAYGSYDVTLTGYTSDGQETIVQSNYITVADAPTVIEAEQMTLSKYIVDNSKMAGKGIMVDPALTIPSTGTAVKTYIGSGGTFDITINTVPENDGQPTIKLYVAGSKVWEQQLPMDAAYYNSEYDRLDYTVTGVTIRSGDEIKIEGNSHYDSDPLKAAFGRVDKITLQPTGAASIMTRWIDIEQDMTHTGEMTMYRIDGRKIDQAGNAGIYLQVGGKNTIKTLILK